MTDYEIVETYAKALHENKILTNLLQEKFQKELTVFVEYNPRKFPTEAEAPFCYLFKNNSSNDLSKPHSEHEIGLILGISDSVEIKTEYGSKLSAFEFLSKELVPCIEKIFYSTPHLIPQNIEREFLFEAFPLVFCALNITITQNTPIGKRY